MELTVERFGFGNESTLGEWLVDNIHECWSLEDERRTTKVLKKTAIPCGRYRVVLRTDGTRHHRYTLRFPDIHIGVLQLEDVPNFVAIQIHPGNDHEDTEGCVLTGTHPVILPNGEFKVVDSTSAYLKLYKKVIDAILAGDLVFVTIKEREPKP
jgi:hypothetical protein